MNFLRMSPFFYLLFPDSWNCSLIYCFVTRYDGEFFADNLETKMADRMKRGKLPQRIRYLEYCHWAHSLMVGWKDGHLLCKGNVKRLMNS